MPANVRAQYDNILNIGAVCVIAKLKRSVTPHFWLNIVDPTIDIPGIIEFSNLRPLPATIVYVPYYMPHSHPKWQKDNAYFETEVKSYLRKLNPALNDDDFLSIKVARLRYAQPVCPPEFLKSLPPVVTSIEGLQVADTCFYYPEDRGISESVRLAKEMAARLNERPAP
jgi:protoporphyrinogen oxidase